jgi:hypothetical protein
MMGASAHDVDDFHLKIPLNPRASQYSGRARFRRHLSKYSVVVGSITQPSDDRMNQLSLSQPVADIFIGIHPFSFIVSSSLSPMSEIR